VPAAVTPAPIEIYDPPAFEPGQKVRALQSVRNDGTYPGVARGSMLIDAGDVGYVQSVGEFLQRYYIYAVDFYERGRIVGMRQGELEMIETNTGGGAG
jgi:nitrogen fixation protein NifZ